MSYINLNGKLVESAELVLQAANRSFRYGYGLFETMLVVDGIIQLNNYHWKRLWQGMQQLKFVIPKLFTDLHLQDQVLRTVAKNRLDKLCRVRLQVFPGNGGLYDGDSFDAQYLIECFPLDEHITSFNENGLALGIADGLAKSNDALANLKTCNAAIYVHAALQAKENRWNDAFILNNAGHIIETTIANLFWVKNGIIYTTPLSEGCIAGVMRAYILDKAAEKSIEIKQKPLPVAELMGADEIFLTNAIRRVKWVKSAGDAVFSCTESQRISAIIF